ncbi:unnamed protein product [Cylicocyclus nassatus]|uniref:Uncharacterized protein n=1 Tax=Cylicocyclus nassatus TaxID=53992 RepID=A0AA36GRY1_CYLNA|nr:unnamed protein product [Cylicocyclus nassatus]
MYPWMDTRAAKIASYKCGTHLTSEIHPKMSGARGLRRGVGVYGRAFEERMRQRQLDVEHTRRLREIAAQGGSVDVEIVGEPREPETSSAAAGGPRYL